MEGAPPLEPQGLTQYTFGSYRNSDPPATITLVPTQAMTSGRAPVAGGLYCYLLANNAPMPPAPSPLQILERAEAIALTMTWTPSP